MEFRELALNIGLPLDFTVKEFKLYELLSKLIASGFEFPIVGGTAINKLYLHGEGRFSEDIDFEIYGKRKIDIPRIDGFDIKGPFIYKRNIRYEAEYNVYRKDKIRIDINIKPSAKVRIIRKTAIFLTGNTIVGVPTFTLEGLIARKLLAMLRRIEGKDFYDLWHSLEKVKIKTLKKEINFISKLEKLKDSWLEDLLKKIKKINWKELKKFNNYIPLEKRPNWQLLKKDIEFFLSNFI